MASSKINDLTQLAILDTGDMLAVVDAPDGSAASRKLHAGQIVNLGGLVLLERGSAVTTSSVKNIDVRPYTITRGFIHLKLVLTGITVDTDGIKMRMRHSFDSGATYAAGASDYGWGSGAGGSNTDTWTSSVRDAADSGIEIMDNIGNGAQENCDAEIDLYTAGSKVDQQTGLYRSFKRHAGTHHRYGSSLTSFNADITHIQILMNSGDIDAGNYYLYGYQP